MTEKQFLKAWRLIVKREKENILPNKHREIAEDMIHRLKTEECPIPEMACNHGYCKFATKNIGCTEDGMCSELLDCYLDAEDYYVKHATYEYSTISKMKKIVREVFKECF